MLPVPFETRDLDPRDWPIIGNHHRFGGMHSRQIARDYRNLRLARDRLCILRDSGILKHRDRQLEGVVVYELADRRYFHRHFGFRGHTIRDSQLGHDIAVVDLVQYLEARHPAAVTYAEIQVSRALNRVKWQATAQPYGAPRPHTPDALLVEGKTVTAIELEHSKKSPSEYARICQWYAAEVRIDQIWWFTDDPAIERLIRRVNTEHGFDDDIPVRIEPFPPGVVVRAEARR